MREGRGLAPPRSDELEKDTKQRAPSLPGGLWLS
jgi:hypothetical protein